MTTPEQREAARLRSERWRRRHGIMPRKPAQRPWLAEGCSRSTWYRRGGKIGDMTKGAKAMAYAVHYPEPSTLKRKGSGSLATKDQFSGALLSQARTVLKDNPVESLYRAEAFTRRLQRELTAAAGFMTVAGSILREFPLSRP